MHAAHPAPRERLPDLAQPATSARTLPPALTHAKFGPNWVCLSVLLVACGLSLVDGLFGGVVAYERDTAVFYYPLMAWAGQQLQHGVLPLWSPLMFGGYPIFADGEIGLAYPPVLLALLTLPPDRALVLLRLAHLFLAAAGCYALARVWGLTYAASTLAGITFALGSFLQAQTHHENIVRTAAWLPLVLALVERALRSVGWQRLAWTVGAGLALGLAGLSLHSQVLAIDLIGLGLYTLFRLAVGPIRGARGGFVRRLRSVLAVAVGCVALGFGLAAVQILPLLELASFSPRGSGIPYGDAAAYSLTPPGLSQLIFPFVFRGANNEQWGLWTHWESYLYVGLAPLLLATLALVCLRRREVGGWAAFGLVGLLLALGQYSPINLHYLLWLVPGVSGLRAPGRFTLLVVLALAMLAAYGLSWLQAESHRLNAAELPRPSRRLRRLLVGVWALPIGLALLLVVTHALLLAAPDAAAWLINTLYLSQPRDIFPLTTSDVYTGLLWSTNLANGRTLGALVGLLSIAGVLFVWQRRRRAASNLAPSVLVAATLIDLVVFSWSIHPRTALSTLAAEAPAARALTAASDGQPFRVLASPVINQVASNRLAPVGQQDANGYSSLESTWHRDYLERVLRTDDQLLDLWNVRYLLDPAHYGVVPTSHDVMFLARQPMLQGGLGSQLGDQSFQLDTPTQAVEGRLVLSLLDAVEVPQDAPVGEVIMRGADGAVLATYPLEAGRDVMDWGWDHPTITPYVRHNRVEVAGVAYERGGAPPNQRLLSLADFLVPPNLPPVATVELRASPPHGELAVFGMALIDGRGTPHQLFGRRNVKYHEVYRDAEVAVLENTAALPRAFVVSGAQTPSSGTALDAMEHQPFDPRTEAIVAAADASAANLPEASGEVVGSAHIQEYVTDRVRLQASASQDALLVLTDTFYPGWRAFVDGQEQPIVRTDLLFRGVRLPAGDHQVELRFDPTSVKLGLAISLASLAVAMGLLAMRWRRG